MAESVQYHLERMLPELEDLENRGVFTKPEIKLIVKKRTALEYAIHRRISRRSDYLRYIEYEKNLELLRKKRKQRLRLEKTDKKGSKGSLSENSIVRRIHALYQNALKKFPGDLNLWIQYIDWSKSTGNSKALGRSFARAIQLHLSKPAIWILAAKWEFEDNNDMTSARVLLQRGLRINSESKNLWHEYFKLELLYIAKLKERRRILFGGDKKAATVSESNGILKSLKDLEAEAEDSGEAFTAMADELSASKKVADSNALETTMVIPKIVFKNAIKAIPNDFEFRKGFVDIYREFGDDTAAAQEEVLQSILEDFAENVDALAIFAEYKSKHVDVDDPNFPMALKETVVCYQEFAENLSSSRMWFLFISFLNSVLSRTSEENLKLYLTTKIKSLRESCDKKGLADETIYISWIRSCTDPEEKIEVLEKALAKFQASPSIWIEKAEALPTQAESVYTSALAVVGKEEVSEVAGMNRLLLWVSFLKWLSMESEKPFSYIEGQYRKALMDSVIGFTRGEEISVLYLEWINSIHGIDRARTAFDWLSSHQRGTRRAIETILRLELTTLYGSGASNEAIANCRRLYSKLCELNGESADIWIKFIGFELNVAKDLSKASELQWRAMKSVLDKDEFVQAYDRLKNGGGAAATDNEGGDDMEM
ncbi:U3 snoRNP protein [Phlyctochytrium planicorne]|nr:U3 snoRNP protein [Phlyctochytrium planicorne]